MKIAPLPKNEFERLENLRYLEILDTINEEIFDNIVQIASAICETPIALISLIDEKRQWFKARIGLDPPETPREVAFCAHAILGESLFEISDSRKDERFHDNPLVTGSPNVVFYAGQPLKTSQNHNIGTLCVIDNKPKILTDVQKNILEKLSKQVVQLIELKVKASELEIARKEAVAANQSKLDFIAAISHDIRNPLNSLFGLADILDISETDPEKKVIISQFKNSADVILRIVNDIIDLSRFESQGLQESNRIFALDQTLVSILTFFKSEAKRKGIEFDFFRAPEIRNFYFSDERKIEKILWNLLSNAFKFTSAGKVSFRIETEDKDSTGCKIKITIEDTGPGIAPEVLPNLFQKYASFSPKEVEMAGSGLGLSIVQSSLNALGGSIETSSQKGVGTKFVIKLQLQPGLATSEIPSHKEETLSEEIVKKRIRSIPILVADDNEMNRKILLNYLKPFGAICSEAKTGFETVDWAKENKAGILFVDIEMPGLSGVEAIQKIERKQEHEFTFVACTGLCLPEEKEKIMDAGFDFYIPKPYNKNLIRDAIVHHLQRF